MKTQRSSSQFFSLCGVVTQLVGHIIPIICSVAKVSTNLAVILMEVAMTADTLGRAGPKAHQLRHGCGQTTHNGMASRPIGVIWAAIIIGIGLIPLGLTKIASTTAAMARNESAMLEH